MSDDGVKAEIAIKHKCIFKTLNRFQLKFIE